MRLGTEGRITGPSCKPSGFRQLCAEGALSGEAIQDEGMFAKNEVGEAAVVEAVKAVSTAEEETPTTSPEPARGRVWSYRLNRYLHTAGSASPTSPPAALSPSSPPSTTTNLPPRSPVQRAASSPSRREKSTAPASATSPSHLSPRSLFGSSFLRRGLSVGSQASATSTTVTSASSASGSSTGSSQAVLSPLGGEIEAELGPEKVHLDLSSRVPAYSYPYKKADDSSTPGQIPAARKYETKNLSLSISPPLDASRFPPGQIFRLELHLGAKVSLSSFERIEIRLVGTSQVATDPPEQHDFLSVPVSILPPSPMVHSVSLGQRSFGIDLQLPAKQNCDCHSGLTALDLPSTYSHQYFRTTYRLELNAKKVSTFGKNERLIEPFIVYAPPPGLSVPLYTSIPLNLQISGTDSKWMTSISPKAVLLTGSTCRLAWKILSPPNNPSIALIPYRLTLHFSALPAPATFLEALANSGIRVTVSRRVTLVNRRSGKEEPLPSLLVAAKQKNVEQSSGIVGGRFVQTGELEVFRHDCKSLSTCNAWVRYMLTARVLPSVGLQHTFEVQGRGLNLDFLALSPPPSATPLPIPTASLAPPAGS
ncbi:hypothetical protein JCM8547_008608 [Rhodosporidiobolus lusitaniae]